MTLFESGGADIDEPIDGLRVFVKEQMEQTGAVRLADIITHSAGMGLYLGNISLYVMGAAIRDLSGNDGVVFYDGAAYWRYAEVRDISSWFMRVYDFIAHSRSRYACNAALFYDDTGLKERLAYVFGIRPTSDKRLDTLGTATVMISKWIVEHLRYPIAFLDGTLHKILSGSSKGVDTVLYGETLGRYDRYFTRERCEYLKECLPLADEMARRRIKETVGFDPDTTRHGMSGLPGGHYAPVLFSAEGYIEEMLKEPRWAV